MITIMKIELLKLKGSRLLLLTILLPGLAVGQGLSFYTFVGSRVPPEEGWLLLFAGSTVLYAPLALPALAALIPALVARIEYQQDSWKQVFALPVRREQVYAAKLLISLGLLGASLLALVAGTAAVGMAVGIPGKTPLGMLVERACLMGLAALPMAAVQFYLSCRFKNILVPLGAAAGLSLPAFLAANTERLWLVYPWSYPTVFALSGGALPAGFAWAAAAISFGLFAGISAYSLRHFSLRDIV